jgi:hypothetical protein
MIGPMKIAAKWGVILGLVVIVWTLLLHALGFYTTDIGAGQVADIAATLLPIVAIVAALRERRATGSLTLGHAVITGLGVGLVSLPITAGFLWAYHHLINPEWSELIVAYRWDVLTQSGASAEAIAAMETAQRASATDVAQLLGAAIGTPIVSVVIALIAGLFMRRKPAVAA